MVRKSQRVPHHITFSYYTNGMNEIKRNRCLADHLADIENEVYIYCRSQLTIDSLNNHQKNPKYLTDHVFNKNMKAIGPNLEVTLNSNFLLSCDVILFAIPTQSMRSILSELNLQKLEKVPLLVFVNKGIEIGTNYLPLEVIEEVCGKEISNVATFLVSLRLFLLIYFLFIH